MIQPPYSLQRWEITSFLFMLGVLMMAPIASSQTQQGDQAILSRITQIIKKIEALEVEQQELRTRQEQAIEKIISLKTWANRFR